ncbi:hypothetical protein D3C87_485440 [compost metagenome]
MPAIKHLAAALFGATLLLGGCSVTLWGPGPTGTGANSGTNNSSGTGGTAKVGLADKSFKLNGATESAAVDVWAGTYPVAIFKTPASDTGRMGAGTLEVKRDGRVVSMALSDASGKLIRKSATSLDFESWSVGLVQVQESVSQLIVDETAATHRRMLGQFGTGTFHGAEGQVGGQAGFTEPDIYHFRNNVEYVGAAVPEVFAQLAGTWKGPQEANTHGKPDVTVTIAADGTVTISGKAALSGAESTVTAKWDGQDDYIAPDKTLAAGDFVIMLNSTHGGGSQAEGGIKLIVPALSGSPILKYANANLSGMNGALTVNVPAKQ